MNWRRGAWVWLVGLCACAGKGDAGEAAGETSGESDGSGGSSTTLSPTTTNGGTSSATTTTSSTTGADTGGSDDTMSFIAPPDGGVSGQCDPMAQDCPEGEKCTAYSNTEGQPWNANKCVPDDGDGQAGDPCDIEGGKYTGIDNCDVGLICLMTDDMGLGGACVEFCNARMTCDNGGTCAIYNDGSLPICLVTCDPLVQDCPMGQGCYASATTNDFVCFKYSGMDGEGAPGDPCNYLNQCQPGTACLDPTAVEGCGAEAGCCSPFCDLSDPDPNANCNPTEMCEAWYTDPPPAYVNVGVCAIPM
jgi:hypothetical protein